MQEDSNNDVKGADHQHKRTNTKGVEQVPINYQPNYILIYSLVLKKSNN